MCPIGRFYFSDLFVEMSFLSMLWQRGFDSYSYGILPRIRRMEVIKVMQFSRNKLKISYIRVHTNNIIVV